MRSGQFSRWGNGAARQYRIRRVAGRDEYRRPSEQDGLDHEEGELRRVPPGRRTLTQTIGGAPGAGATASPGKISLAHRIQSSAPLALPYRDEMEAGFGQGFPAARLALAP